MGGWPFGGANALYREFVREPGFLALRRILDAIIANGSGLDVAADDFRERVFTLDWKASSDQLQPSERELVFNTLDEYLLNPVSVGSQRDWQSWIRMSRAAARTLSVGRPLFARAILKAKREGKLDALPTADADYLCSCYMHAYGAMLEKSGPGDRQLLLSVAIEFAALAQLTGPTEYSSRVLRRWTQHARLKPRSLAMFSEEEWFDAPIRGVGSPNGVSVTLYHAEPQGVPSRIAYAGMTGDRTLNAHVLAAVFSAGLASNSERSFVTTAGGILHLGGGRAPASPTDVPASLHVAIGPDGRPLETEAGVSTLGMTPDEAFGLVAESFQRFSHSTGLASVIHWGVADADSLEARVREALGDVRQPARRIKSDPTHSESGCVIHVMPLFHRNAEGSVEPLRIPLAYADLAPDAVLKLTRAARQAYMGQLIADGRRREVIARDMHKQQDESVKNWEAKNDAQKEAFCKAQPFATITHSFDFDLGISTPLNPPESIPTAEFEHVRRPKFRDAAARYAEKFGALCEKLEALNRSQGLADRLTFGLLVDAAIRREPLPIAGSHLDADYAVWSDHVAGLVWGVFEQWAARRRYPAELMAADNILFIPESGADGKMVSIQPHVLIDMHNFEITIDATEGVIYVLPGGRPVSLRERIVPSPEHGITDPTSLYRKFREWSETRLTVLATRAHAEKHLRQDVMRERRFAGLVLFKQGRHLLLRGEYHRSIAAFERARRADLAPVYFWGAIAHQCKFLREWHAGLADTATRGHTERLIRTAISTLVESTNRPSTTSTPAALWTGQLEVPIPTTRAEGPTRDRVPEARSFWSQLLARDPVFVDGLAAGSINLAQWESDSLGITPVEEERLSGATRALCALDFLALAERMKTVARSLPFTGLPTSALRADLEGVVTGVRAMPFGDPPGKDQIEELRGRLNQA